MNTTGRWLFVRGGIQQALWVCGAAALLSAIGMAVVFFCKTSPFAIIGKFGLLMLLFTISLLSGPVPSLLTLLDISNQHLYLLWIVFVPVYWVLLGTLAGLWRWPLCAAEVAERPVVPSRQNRKQIRWFIEIAALLLAVMVYPIGPIAGPHHIGSRHSPQSRIHFNLMRIDSAKQQFAWEKQLTPDYRPTEVELSPYLRSFHPIGPERYVLNSLGEPPYAVLDSDWRIRRRGWHEGYTIPRQEFRLPPVKN